MSFRCHMLTAIASLEAALQAAERDRDQGVPRQPPWPIGVNQVGR